MAVENFIGTDMNALPENCIANVLSLTNPKDACRLSLVASNFHSAAQSDAVWERFLPPDYRDVISRAANSGDLLALCSKKDLYFHLSDHPIIIDGGDKSFSLDKGSGKKCYMLAARSLYIEWGNDPRYWTWIPLAESRFSEATELITVCWLEIRGEINTKMLSPDTNYAAYLVFKLRSDNYGFQSLPVNASIRISEQEANARMVCFDPNGILVRPRYSFGPWQMEPIEEAWRTRNRVVPRRPRRMGQNVNSTSEDNNKYPYRRDDNWVEVELGDFFIRGGEEDLVDISLKEVLVGHWKSGIIVQGIDIRPK